MCVLYTKIFTMRVQRLLAVVFISCPVLFPVVQAPNHDDDVYPRQQQQCIPAENQDTVQSGTRQAMKSRPTFTCVRDKGVDPPKGLENFMTSLLHERDVTHHMTWEGNFWTMGSGAYADVHLGRLASTGECIVIKRFSDSSLKTIEREIRMHRYIEGVLPNTPRLLGVLLTGPNLENCSLVYQLVPDSHTLNDWLDVRALSAVQWLNVALQMATLLERLHRKCVLHNDLHSSNILLHTDEIGERHVIDCGISRFEQSEDDEDTRLYRSFTKVTPPMTLLRVTFIDFGHATFRRGKVYKGSEESLESCRHLAPEAVRHQETTRAADVYSLGHELENIAKVLNSSSLQDVASLCTSQDPETRPPVSAVVHTLRKLFLDEYRRALRQESVGPQPLGRPPIPPSFAVQNSLLQASTDTPLPSSAQKAWREEKGCLHCSGFCCTQPLQDEAVGGGCGGRCCPEVLEHAVQKLKLPFITFTGDLSIQREGEKRRTLVNSEHTVIFVGQFHTTGDKVVVKHLKRNSDYFRVRYEAMINLYLNETGWVPRFYGVVPLNKYDSDKLCIVQELFADGVTLADVLKSGRPVGVVARARLAFRLTSLVHDVHSRHMLINNLRKHNILCACVNDTDCSDIRIIDVYQASGCEGIEYDEDESHLRQFLFVAPEVRRNHLTSFASDVYSLCVILNDVLDRGAALDSVASEMADKVRQILLTWDSLSKICLSNDPRLRPTTTQLKHFFSAFIKSTSL